MNNTLFLLGATILYDNIFWQSLNPILYWIFFFNEFNRSIEPLKNVFFSWLLVGIWICFTVKFFQLIKSHREFNSPHNTSFFISGSLSVGIIYSIWGNFIGLHTNNLFEDITFYLEGTKLYLNPWVIIFSYPYLIYGAILLYFCYKRYYVVHVGQRSVSSLKYGILCSVLIILVEIGYLLFFFAFEFFELVQLQRVNTNPNLMILFLSIYALFLLVIYGSSPRVPVIPEVTTPVRPVSTTRREVRVTTRTTPTSRRPKPITTVSTTRRPKPTPSTRNIQRTTVTVSPARKVKARSLKKFKKYLPKVGVLTIEDFKCIICFNLPKLPTDRGRGIILCPKCRYPAHADEFKDWLRSSKLCSRCDSPIPVNFRHSPKIIPVEKYLEIIDAFSAIRRKKKS